MTEYETLDALLAEKGQPALLLDATSYSTKKKRWLEDVCSRYAIYFSAEAAGGCIAYGETRDGWVVNPSLRWPLLHLTQQHLLTTQGNT